MQTLVIWQVRFIVLTTSDFITNILIRGKKHKLTKKTFINHMDILIAIGSPIGLVAYVWLVVWVVNRTTR